LKAAGDAGEGTSGPRGRRSARSVFPSPRRENRVRARELGGWRSSKRFGKGVVRLSVDGEVRNMGSIIAMGVLVAVEMGVAGAETRLGICSVRF
jgi:hypothetical protein